MVLLAPPAWREFPPSVYAASTARADASAELPHTLRGSASLPAIGSGSMLGGPHMRRRRQRLADPSRPSKAAMARARRHVWKNEVRALDAFRMQCLLHTASTHTSSTYGHVMCMRMHRPYTCTFGAHVTFRAHCRCMHLGQVKIWMRQHDCGADWELPEAEQHQLTEWFNALDIDGSGGAAAC